MPFHRQLLATQRVGDDRRSGEKAISPGVVGMVVSIDDISHREVQLLLDEISDLEGLIRDSEGINDDSPIGTYHCSGCYLSINIALEIIDVVSNTLTLHFYRS
jgi:hypothetical protein